MGTILVVEDDVADQKLIKASIAATKSPPAVVSVSSGEEAIDFLRTLSSQGAALPDLTLLDLNMPGMGGREFLRRIKLEEELKQIPVVVLTSSNSERDILESYRLHASGYLHKPCSLFDLKEMVAGVEQYWFTLCKLPHKEKSFVG